MALNGYLGILRWSLAQTSDGTGLSAVSSMSAEDKAWLQEAMSSQVVDLNENMRLIVAVLRAEAPHGDDEKAAEVATQQAKALDDATDYVENIDLARNFCNKLRGLEPVVGLLRSPHSAVRWRAASVLGMVVQNHPETQRCALQLGALPLLVSLVSRSVEQREEKGAVKARVKRHSAPWRHSGVQPRAAAPSRHTGPVSG